MGGQGRGVDGEEWQRGADGEGGCVARGQKDGGAAAPG